MPVNRNALIRYKTIDQCLRNPYRKWTLEDLIDACSDALYEYEGIDKGISKRAVQMDIQMMRSDKLGYNAPIKVKDRKYYYYEDPEYSITKAPLSNHDLNKLTEVVDILKEFKGFSHFREMTGMIQRLEDKVNSTTGKQKPVVHLEKNEDLRGLEYLEVIYQAILKKQVLDFTYQSFKARAPGIITFHAYLLKEYRNRWFVLGRKSAKQPMMTLALDRIKNIGPNHKVVYIDNLEFNADEYFKDVVGVTVNEGNRPQKIHLFIDRSNAPYVITKPLHSSQQLISKSKKGVEITINVIPNYELEREILGFGDSMRVISPLGLRKRIFRKLSNSLKLYEIELNEDILQDYKNRLEKEGFVITSYIYSKSELEKIQATLEHYLAKKGEASEGKHAIRRLLIELPELTEVLLNENLKQVLTHLGNTYFLSKAIFFDKPAESNWYVTWHQDTTINVKEKSETKGFTSWTKKGNTISVCPPEQILHNTVTIRIHLDPTTVENGALRVIPGSHKKRLSNEEISVLTNNSTAINCEIRPGGIQMMKPLLLHASSKSTNQKRRRVIHLEFCSEEIPNEMNWAERIDF